MRAEKGPQIYDQELLETFAQMKIAEYNEKQKESSL
jgi:hypothetical protein